MWYTHIYIYKSEPRPRRASVQGRRKRPSAGQRVSPAPNGCRRPDNGILIQYYYIILLYIYNIYIYIYKSRYNKISSGRDIITYYIYARRIYTSRDQILVCIIYTIIYTAVYLPVYTPCCSVHRYAINVMSLHEY